MFNFDDTESKLMKRTFVNPVIKDTITFLQTTSESGGRVSEPEITLMPGGGNPVHYHKTYAETFIVIDGAAQT